MAATPQPTAQTRLGELDWGEISVRLFEYIRRRLGTRGSLADVQDLTNETITRMFDDSYKPWDPAAEPDPMRFLGSVANSLIANFGSRKRRTAEKSYDQKPGLVATKPALGRRPDQQLADAEMSARAEAAISERLADDPLCAQILELFRDGVETPRAQVAATGIPRSHIKNARRRLAGHLEAVRVLLDDDATHDQEGAS